MGAARRIRQRMRRAVQQAATRDEGDPSRAETINVSDPSNIVVSGTVGEPGAVRGTSSGQTVRVSQDGTETYEESETTTELRSH